VKSKSSKKSYARILANKVIARSVLAFVALAVPGVCFAQDASAQNDKFFFSTGNTDGLLGALSRRPSPGKLETETADDFVLTKTTVISRATITGLITPATPLANITSVEVEMYRVFPDDSDVKRAIEVPSRGNSPADVEIDTATRNSGSGTLRFAPSLLNANFTVANTVVNGIHKKGENVTHGELSATGDEVEIDITFSTPIVLPAGNYFFRPEVGVTGGDFLYLSAPRPIVSPGTPFGADKQAWIRNSQLLPDWLRIGTDIIVGNPPTFNMTFSLAGETVANAGIPGRANCHGQSIAALTAQFGDVPGAASALGFSSVDALQDGFTAFCKP
jgi:hypothetical protein